MRIVDLGCTLVLVAMMTGDAGADDAPPPASAEPAAVPVASPAERTAAPLARPGAAGAPPAGRSAVDAPTDPRMSLGVNLPLRWSDGDSVAGSVYVGLSEHHAIRGNVATYKAHGSAATDVIAALANSDGEEVSHHGRVTDVGVSWVYYPRRVWDGLLLEAGVLRRARNVGTYDSERTFAYDDKDTSVWAGRGLIGWSWLFGDHFFVAAAAGLSIGYESGFETQRTDDSRNPMTKRSHVSRQDTTGEAYLRVGLAFGL